MTNAAIAPVAWNLLVSRIRADLCVPFLGAGANVSSTAPEYRGLPLGRALAATLAQELQHQEGTVAELARVSLEYEMSGDRPGLTEFLKQELPDQACEPSPLLRTLARLPFGLYVTTNYDHLLERALQEAGRDYRVIVQPAGGFLDTGEVQARFTALETYEGALIYKIHGTFRASTLPVDPPVGDEDPVIITEDDYIDFLTVIEGRQDIIGVPKLIRSRLTPRMLLFLGYGLEDWDFRTLHRGLVMNLTRHQQRMSLAIQRNPPQFWVDYWRTKGVRIYDMDLYEFATRLEDRFFGAGPGDG